jgi:hypothetical protein
MGDVVTSLLNGFDKLTDILNVGRLIFYTSSGFCTILPGAMIIRLLEHGPSNKYWVQFTSDLIACATKGAVWIAALVLGFVLANLAYAALLNKLVAPAGEPPKTQGLAYHYPRLSAGGAAPTTEHDLAAWWISEYYRYVEIAAYIPFALLLSLPLYSLYSLVYLILKCNPAQPFIIGPAHCAFAAWALLAVLGWGIAWPRYWVPAVITPISTASDQALSELVAGQIEFSKENSANPAKQPDKGA